MHGEGVVAIAQREGPALRVERTDHVEHIVAGPKVAGRDQRAIDRHRIDADAASDRRGRTTRALQ
ncbi:hypothetical protein D3C80_2071860 [compost metagenome]